MAKINRKKLIEDYKNGILNDDYDVFHCKETDKYSTRKKVTKQSKQTTEKKDESPQTYLPKSNAPTVNKSNEPSLRQLKDQFRM